MLCKPLTRLFLIFVLLIIPQSGFAEGPSILTDPHDIIRRIAESRFISRANLPAGVQAPADWGMNADAFGDISFKVPWQAGIMGGIHKVSQAFDSESKIIDYLKPWAEARKIVLLEPSIQRHESSIQGNIYTVKSRIGGSIWTLFVCTRQTQDAHYLTLAQTPDNWSATWFPIFEQVCGSIGQNQHD